MHVENSYLIVKETDSYSLFQTYTQVRLTIELGRMTMPCVLVNSAELLKIEMDTTISCWKSSHGM